MLKDLEILFEDNHIICINKKSSDIVQGDKTGDVPLVEKIKDYIKEKYKKPGNVFCGVVHRIDRPTSGVVIFARTTKALRRLNEMIKNKEIKKTYLAIVEKKKISDKQILVHYLIRNEKQNKSYAYEKEEKNSKKAILQYEILKILDNYLILKINLETGRHHQIRSQFSKIGIPVKGDIKYGAKRANADKSISLHSWKAEFIHPVSKQNIIISAPLPKSDIWNVCEGIKDKDIEILN